MIVFLTLCYIAVLAILVKFKFITLNLWWKLSPVVWLLLLLVVLFIPMQWGAPSGNVTMYQLVVEITPNVDGTVTEVQAQTNRFTKKGEVLFEIDPRPFQYKVEQTEAALAAAEQGVPQLKAAWDAAIAATATAEAKRDLAKIEYDLAVKTQRSDAGAISQLKVKQERETLNEAEAALMLAQANERQAQLAYQSEIGGVNTKVAQLQAILGIIQPYS